MKGEGNQQDYGMRVYDPRIGKFLSVDPLFKAYPDQTPYTFAANSPLVLIDQEGEGPEYFDPPVKTKTQPKIYVRRKVVVETDAHHVSPPVKESTLRRWWNGFRKIGEATSVVAMVLESANGDYAGAGASDGNERAYPKDLEYVTTDYSLLPDDYLQEVRKRILTGTASEQEMLYGRELERRGIMATGGTAKKKQRAEDVFSMTGKPEMFRKQFMAAIDFSKSVTIETLKAGESVYRFERINYKGEEMHFFTDAEGADYGDTYGAAAVGMAGDSGYELVEYKVLKDTKVLKSKINRSPIKGVTQYFSTELQYNIKKVNGNE